MMDFSEFLAHGWLAINVLRGKPPDRANYSRLATHGHALLGFGDAKCHLDSSRMVVHWGACHSLEDLDPRVLLGSPLHGLHLPSFHRHL